MVDNMEVETTSVKDQKKRLGAFYTPPTLAEKITNETLNSWLDRHSHFERNNLLEHIKNLKILDPACGDGIFLIEAAKWLDRIRQLLDDSMDEYEKRQSILSKSLFGVDIDDEAIQDCKSNLLKWGLPEREYARETEASVHTNIKRGNSLTTLDWEQNFPSAFSRETPGFDIILGNPPYGNILSRGEREIIRTSYPYVVGGNRTGTWNSAAHFIVKSSTLLRQGGELGFLIPNSILRVKQFTKTRDFLLNHLNLWKIIDEGSPFEGVTLEMVTIFCRNSNSENSDEIAIESRRPNHMQKNTVKREFLQSNNIISIYHDDIFEKILRIGRKGFLTATRGRDIPKEYVKQDESKQYQIPYITSGRSVRRYKIDKKHQIFTNDWYLGNQGMKESYSNEWLVATKNYRYPRCVIKPKGMINGGGIVRIIPADGNVNLRTLGLILNSRLTQYICTRYLTNYSQLTTCLNTGILEELPIVYPANPTGYASLFDKLSILYQNEKTPEKEPCIKTLEKVSEALVYELYFMKKQELEKTISKITSDLGEQSIDIDLFCEHLKVDSVVSRVNEIMKLPVVMQIESQL